MKQFVRFPKVGVGNLSSHSDWLGGAQSTRDDDGITNEQ